MKIEELSKAKHLLVVCVSGFLTSPIIPLGSDSEFYLGKINDFEFLHTAEFTSVFTESLNSFGLIIDSNIKEFKVLIAPITDDANTAVKNSLAVCDIALAFFNKKYISAKAQLLGWDRKNGTSIGAIRSVDSWKPLKKNSPKFGGPAIIKAAEVDFWDWMISSALRGKLNPLGEALFKSLQWERAADFSPDATHRFAFMWIAMESLMPIGEVDEGSFIRRNSLLLGAPTDAAWKKIESNPAQKKVLDEFLNKNIREWKDAIKEMYKYRCKIVHDGASDLNSIEIEPNKVDWFYHIAKRLGLRAQSLGINGLMCGIKTVEELWDDFAIEYLYSNKTPPPVSQGAELNDDLIKFDWKANSYPDFGS